MPPKTQSPRRNVGVCKRRKIERRGVYSRSVNTTFLFDGEVLPYLYPGYQQLGLGVRCASTSQCGNRYCCVSTGVSHPTCQPLATVGRRCSRVLFGNVYRRFCPCKNPESDVRSSVPLHKPVRIRDVLLAKGATATNLPELREMHGPRVYATTRKGPRIDTLVLRNRVVVRTNKPYDCIF
ncbi:uncharacterized protein LOC119373346 isoform X8 [Rhipicephalus sanguineus]|uniref:uncharacterized protein LOC119373346 isoform X5 n=1 Tax=Rhipicephalus sanguineus TaxID=34632 RepID=UPI0020C206BA|nr:uncharacterized protein LOC119373346 isoform X5 [Rhipicephalus sanguineus]XP_049276239.1 uncharacterized protein LOC119373346 isoform X6 [Rhipicephalus sanguineus]XP_049276240.1 uncharacterized protein LOC119373346 isoform X7 [Rhipicephalus sanguineus]XP_049276241.1 uncharacterized protein LOC119373346 isoform X8 [Rhipicephalus sanguineus]